MTERTQQLRSVRQLAAAIGKSPSTAHLWASHPDWKWSRSAPWNAADVPAMKQWADATLRRDNGPESESDPEPTLDGYAHFSAENVAAFDRLTGLLDDLTEAERDSITVGELRELHRQIDQWLADRALEDGGPRLRSAAEWERTMFVDPSPAALKRSRDLFETFSRTIRNRFKSELQPAKARSGSSPAARRRASTNPKPAPAKAGRRSSPRHVAADSLASSSGKPSAKESP